MGAQTHRGDAVELNFDVVGRKVTKARRHQPHEAVENDFQHRQTLIRHHRRADYGADAGIVVERDVSKAETEEAVDLFLFRSPLCATCSGLQTPAIADNVGPSSSSIVSIR